MPIRRGYIRVREVFLVLDMMSIWCMILQSAEKLLVSRCLYVAVRGTIRHTWAMLHFDASFCTYDYWHCLQLKFASLRTCVPCGCSELRCESSHWRFGPYEALRIFTYSSPFLLLRFFSRVWDLIGTLFASARMLTLVYYSKPCWRVLEASQPSEGRYVCHFH